LAQPTEPSQPGALVGSPARIEPDLASRQPPQIVQARDRLVHRAVVVMPLVKVDRGRVDGEVVEHRAERLTWPVAEHLVRDHEYLAAVEVIEKGRQLVPVPAGPEVAVGSPNLPPRASRPHSHQRSQEAATLPQRGESTVITETGGHSRTKRFP
jgi:hypothetical protein